MSYRNLDVDEGNDDHKLADQVKQAGLGSQMSSVIQSQTLNAVCNTAVPMRSFNPMLPMRFAMLSFNLMLPNRFAILLANLVLPMRFAILLLVLIQCGLPKLFAIAFLPDGGNRPRLRILYKNHPSVHFCLTELLHPRHTGK